MKKFSLSFEYTDNGMLNFESTNDGFTGIELLGLLDWKIDDILQQVKGNIKPDVVKRTVISDADK